MRLSIPLRVRSLRFYSLALAAAGVVAWPGGAVRAQPVQPNPPGAARPGAGVQQIQLPYVMRDDLGALWTVQADGSVGGGPNDLFSGGGRLLIAEQQFAPQQQQAAFDRARNEVILPALPMGGVNVTRRLSVNAKAGWCRWVEVLENPAAAPAHVQLHIGFEVGGALQQTKEIVDEKKTKKQTGLAVFDGTHNFAMIGAGRGSKVLPRYQPQPGTDQVDVFYELDVPPKQSVAVVHVQAHRPNFNDAVGLAESTNDKDFLADLPPEVLKVVVNFPHSEKLVGDVEVLRGGLLDVVELRGGDQYRGTLKEASYKLETSYGPLELPAPLVVGMMTMGTFKPVQLFVTADGEAIGGTLQSDAIHLQLSSGQTTSVPLHNVTRLGYRKRPGEPEEWKLDKPMAFLRDGQRIAVEMPAETVPLATVYGPLSLKPDAIAALVFQGEDQAVHQVRLADGSKFSALSRQGVVRPEAADGGRRQDGQLPGHLHRPAATVARARGARRRSPQPLALQRRPAGRGLSGTLELETGFDTIRISGAQVRGLRHATPADAGGAGAAPASPTEVQVTLWDEATLSGRLKGDVLACTLRCGTPVRIPVSLVDRYTQPNPQPTEQILERIRATVAELMRQGLAGARPGGRSTAAAGPVGGGRAQDDARRAVARGAEVDRQHPQGAG